MVRAERPDLLFLDVQMLELDGFQVLERLPSECMPAVFFTTAFDRHAVHAFDTHAVDYLMKPLLPVRFAQAMDKVRGRLAMRTTQRHVHDLRALLADNSFANSGAGYLTRVTVRVDDGVLVVRTADIEAFETAGNYILAHAGAASHLVRDNLTTLESQLDPRRFLRVSRSALVNLDYVRAYSPCSRASRPSFCKTGRRSR